MDFWDQEDIRRILSAAETTRNETQDRAGKNFNKGFHAALKSVAMACGLVHTVVYETMVFATPEEADSLFWEARLTNHEVVQEENPLPYGG